MLAELQREAEKKKRSSTIKESSNFFLKFKQKVKEKMEEKKEAKKKKTIVHLKRDFQWKEATREVNTSAFESGQLNSFERFLLENHNLEHAFNKIMLENLGENFAQSPFCIPLWVARMSSVKVRKRLNLEFLEREEQAQEVGVIRRCGFSRIFWAETGSLPGVVLTRGPVREYREEAEDQDGWQEEHLQGLHCSQKGHIQLQFRESIDSKCFIYYKFIYSLYCIQFICSLFYIQLLSFQHPNPHPHAKNHP